MQVMVNKRIVYTFLSFCAIVVASYFAIQYAKGRFRITDQGFVDGTGLLAANSFPSVAEVLINGKLVGVTDSTFYLEPNQYEIEIVKDGYNPWKKTITIEEELVVQTNATLFPKAPSLNTLTYTGAQNISPSPDGQKLLYYSSANSSTRKNGLYILELTNSTFSFQKEPLQISDNPESIDLTTADFIWSPDSSTVMLIAPEKEILLNITTLNNLETLTDISFNRKQILTEWEQEMYLREQENLSKFPELIVQIATQSAYNVYVSPDKKRLLYTMTEEVTLPNSLIPSLPASNTQPQERELVPFGIYVYDREEDTNFRVSTDPTEKIETTGELAKKQLLSSLLDQEQSVATTSGESATQSALNALASQLPKNTLQASQSAETAQNFNVYHSSVFADTVQWFPNSKHLLYVAQNAIHIMEYDTTNKTTLYSGPFAEGFTYPWPNGDRLIVLTSFSPDAPQNLYAIELKK